MPYKLFSVYGIEIEYMIVDKTSLAILPMADKLLTALAGGSLTNEVELGDIAVSNELARHVIELKTNGPAAKLADLDQAFTRVITQINQLLAPNNAQLLPSGIHPWLDPTHGIELWPHGDRQIYATYDRIFNCSGHGWANLQSTHINLPFANDSEFAKLHAAIRHILPIIPALAASTPIIEGKLSGLVDTRLSFYGKNQAKIPCISGDVIPESVNSNAEYHEKILYPMYQAIASEDVEGVLAHEWLNSRGAIARFDRNAIEIRIVDSQEAAIADITLANIISLVLQKLVAKPIPVFPIDALKKIYQDCIRAGSATLIPKDYVQSLLGYHEDLPAKNLWMQLCQQCKLPSDQQAVVDVYSQQGTLSERMLSAVGKHPTRSQINRVYQQLADCLAANQCYQV